MPSAVGATAARETEREAGRPGKGVWSRQGPARGRPPLHPTRALPSIITARNRSLEKCDRIIWLSEHSK